MNIEINIKNKVATVIGDSEIICGNTNYTISFNFDAEWDLYSVKTVRFVTAKGVFENIVENNTAIIPKVFGISFMAVGVYAGDLVVTTPAIIRCKTSIRCLAGKIVEPQPDKYDQLIAYYEALLSEVRQPNPIYFTEINHTTAGQMKMYLETGKPVIYTGNSDYAVLYVKHDASDNHFILLMAGGVNGGLYYYDNFEKPQEIKPYVQETIEEFDSHPVSGNILFKKFREIDISFSNLQSIISTFNTALENTLKGIE